ncbi:hypothetical protein JQ616_22225 [Bradyrhizobium tropiciagri]|nr:hypothetical protein [Bradyrhizobium tropiciagri]
MVPQAELWKRAMDAAVVLAKRPAGAFSVAKRLMHDQERIMDRAVEEERLFHEWFGTPEAREAFEAFVERRPPTLRSCLDD